MNSRCTISIAMATYNGEKYLCDQLASFVHQTRLPDELVICDDNSNDSTVDIIEEFCKTAPFPVRFYKNSTNIGYTQNFEKLIKKTAGDYIFLSDQDDVWFTDKIHSVLNIFEDHPDILLVVNDQNFVNSKLEMSGVSNLNRLKNFGFSKNLLRSGCCTTFRKELKTIVLPIESNVIGYDIWIHEFAEAMNKKYVHPKILQNHRRHNKNASQFFIKNIYYRFLIKEFIQQFLFMNYTKNYENSIDLLHKIKERLKLHSILKEKQLDLIEAKILSLEKRIDLYNSGFLLRKIKATKMLKNGHYRQLQGLKSFMKDFFYIGYNKPYS